MVTEAFFDHPIGLAGQHPELYGLFEEFYRLTPATWFEK